jgi:hypothetical protein
MRKGTKMCSIWRAQTSRLHNLLYCSILYGGGHSGPAITSFRLRIASEELQELMALASRFRGYYHISDLIQDQFLTSITSFIDDEILLMLLVVVDEDEDEDEQKSWWGETRLGKTTTPYKFCSYTFLCLSSSKPSSCRKAPLISMISPTRRARIVVFWLHLISSMVPPLNQNQPESRS